LKPTRPIVREIVPSAPPPLTHASGEGDAPSMDRRRLLGLLPILAAGCAAPRTSADASATKRTPPTPLEALLDRVVARVSDTSGNLAARSPHAREVRLADLVLFHGHPCDGLMIAARGLALGLAELFGDGPVDRTDLAGATNASVCYGDVLGYLTGARHRYGSLTVDAKLGDEWLLLRRATGDAVRVSLRPGVKPARLVEQEAALRATTCPSDVIAEVASLQRELSERVWSASAQELFTIARVTFPYDPGKLRGDVIKRDCATAVDARP
jgi:formylmethanofuran dehydrogenase subunit E